MVHENERGEYNVIREGKIEFHPKPPQSEEEEVTEIELLEMLFGKKENEIRGNKTK